MAPIRKKKHFPKQKTFKTTSKTKGYVGEVMREKPKIKKKHHKFKSKTIEFNELTINYHQLIY